MINFKKENNFYKMGAKYTKFDEKSIKVFITNIIKQEKQQRLKRRDFLVVSDVLSTELPDESHFNLLHLGLLYCMDVDKDGRYYEEDLHNFGVEIMAYIKLL